MKKDFLSLISQAYQLDGSDSDWHAALAEKAAAVVPGSKAALSYSFDASRPERGVSVRSWGGHGVPESFVKGTIQLNRSTTPEDAALFYHRGILCGTVSEMLRRDGRTVSENDTYSDTVARKGYQDTFGLTASSPLQRGVVVNSPLDEATTLNPREKVAWRQAGVHIQAAYRLRTALRSTACSVEAVIDSEKGVLHCEGDARQPSLRRRLQQAASAIDTARSRSGPSDTLDALELWSGLVAGRWTLIESLESDGRRVFLAYPNDLGLPNPLALTSRERTVVAYVVQGDSNKWISYQLGISTATVARHLSTALAKLRLGHRNELIWLYQKLHSSDRSRKSE